MKEAFCTSGTSPTETQDQPDFAILVDGSIVLLTPKRNSIFHVEEPFVWHQNVCTAFVLWENVVRADEAVKPLLRMTFFLVQSEQQWKIGLLQVTPVTRDF